MTVVEEKQLASPTELLSQAWEIVKSRFWALLLCALIPYLLAFGMVLLMTTFVVGPMLIATIIGGKAPAFNPVMLIPMIFLFLAFLAVMLWQGVALVQLIAGAGEKLGVAEAFKKAWPKIWGVFWVSLISGAISLGAMLPFIFPVFIVGVWFMFSQYVYITEGVGGLKALRISREYVRGKFWAVVGRSMFPILLYIAFGLVQGVFQGVLGKELFSRFQWIFSLLSIPLMLLVTVYQFSLYNNLRQLRGKIEAKDVEAGKTKWILLAVWGLLGWLIIPLGAVVLLVAINPAKQLQKAKETRLQIQQQQPESSPEGTFNTDTPVTY